MRLLSVVFISLFVSNAYAAPESCAKLPDHAAFQSALKAAQQQNNGGLGNPMWGTLTARDGTVCAVAYTGETVDAQWPGSRVVSAQKANTANGFSLPGMALSTANLYAGSQPGGFLYGIENSNPVDTSAVYAGPATAYGTAKDPLVGKVSGGVNVFGGGLALYDQQGTIVGSLGVSGDSSCADHNIAWRTRNGLKLDYVPKGVAKNGTDTIIYDMKIGASSSGFGHPICGMKEDEIVKDLPNVRVKAGTKQ